MVHNWQTFYQLTGAAAGSLIGLMFIVATLTQGRQQSSVQQGAKLYTTPTVFHLTMVLVISALALAPTSDAALTGPLAGLCAVVGAVYAASVTVRILRGAVTTHWSDFWCYGAAPAAVYLGLVGADAGAWAGVPQAAWAAAVLLLLLLIVAIRNAWDLVTWLAPRRFDGGS